MLEKPVIEVIRENYKKMFSAEKKVADYILAHPRESVDANVSELARGSGVSDATVVRMCHHLGYKGYYQFRVMLAKDMGRENASSSENALDDDKPDVVMDIFKRYANQMIAIGQNMNNSEMRACVKMIKNCRQAHILALGNTTPLAFYMGFRLGRLGVKCTYSISAEYFMNNVNLADEGDIIIAISQSGSSIQIVQGMELGREKGLKMMAITGYEQSPISKLADHVLISNGLKESFDFYKSYAHLNETAIIDALLELTMNWETIHKKAADKPEEILSASKY
jgi:RpiR family carbohydrate utilization transcriptional regulator